MTPTAQKKTSSVAKNTSFTIPNRYWFAKQYLSPKAKSLKDMLDARGYYTGSIMEKDKLRECLRRSDRGLLSYLSYTNDELRQLIEIRDIDTGHISGDKGHRGELIYVLENEDNNRKFPNFTRLPPELRTRVYKHYFEDFGESLHAPKQPPITLASSLLRKESLPLFYSICTFDFNLVATSVNSRDTSLKISLKIPSMTLMWLCSTEDVNIADITKIRVRVCLCRDNMTQSRAPLDSILHEWNTRLDFQLHRCDTSNAFRMEVVPLASSSRAWPDRARLTKNVLRAIKGTGNPLAESKVNKNVFFAIRRAIEISVSS